MAERDEIERKKNFFYFWVHSVFRKYIEVTMDLILVLLVGVTFIFILKTIYLLSMTIYHIPYPAYDLGIPVHIHSYRGDEDFHHIYRIAQGFC